MKFLNWLSKMILTAVLISGISIYTTWYTVHTMMEDMLQKMNLHVSAPPLNLVDWVTKLAQQTGLLRQIASADSPRATESGGRDPRASSTDREQPGVNSVVPSASADSDPFKEEAAPAWSQAGQEQRQKAQVRQQAGDAAASQRQEDIVMSAEDFSKKKELLSNEDKVKIFSLLVNRLPQEDVQKISAFVENGITGDELKQMDALVKNRLKPEEYRQLLDILGKY